MDCEDTIGINAFFLADDAPVVRLADRAIRAAGLEPVHTRTGGGSDAHEFNSKGIWSAILGMGCTGAHTTEEFRPTMRCVKSPRSPRRRS